jgi:heme exporter protein D
MTLLFKILGVVFALFVVLFIAIVIEESFLGGRRRRKLEREARMRQAAQEEAGKE